MTGSLEGKAHAFRDPEVRKELAAQAVEGIGVTYDIFSRRWDLIFVHDTVLEKNQGLIGKSVAQVAQEQGKGILDAFLDLALEEDLGTEFEAIQLGGDEASMAKLLNSPYTVVGLSDAGAHLVFEANDGFSTFFLGHWVREKQIMSLEKAVRRITFDSASMFGMHDRGLIRPRTRRRPGGLRPRHHSAGAGGVGGRPPRRRRQAAAHGPRRGLHHRERRGPHRGRTPHRGATRQGGKEQPLRSRVAPADRATGRRAKAVLHAVEFA